MLDRNRRASVLRRRLFRWHRGAARAFPWRDTDDPYKVLIGEFLLQRTRGENVVAVYEALISRWPDPQLLGTASPDDLRTVIRPLGLAKRTDTLVELAAELNAIGRVPTDPTELGRLHGIGPYISHAVPVFAANRNLPLVDWVIARVLRRYFDLPSGRRPNADRELWDLAAMLVRPGRARETWLAILDLAAAVCTTRPRCFSCPLLNACAYQAGAVRS